MAIDLTQLEQDAIALAKQIFASAKSQAVAVLQVVETDITGAVPTLDTDVENIILEFVPSAFRSMVQAFLSGEKSNLDAAAIAAIKAAFAIVISRLDALIKA